MSISLRAEGLSYRYPQHGLGLQDIDLLAAPGETWVITGPSGCGKSTLARCLAGLIPHLYRGEMRGQVWVGDLRTDQAEMWQIAERVGLMFQNPAVQSVASTVEEEVAFGLENLGLPAKEIESRITSSLQRFGLTGLGERSPQTLSGGEQQRLMLAATLARQTGALVLDEPLSMLDTAAATQLVADLADLRAQGGTVVVCEHRDAYFHGGAIHRYAMAGGHRAENPSLEAGTEQAQVLPPLYQRQVEIAIRGLELGHGERRLFEGLDLQLPGGEVVALVGRNGVGKTTLLRACAGLHPYTGQIAAADGTRPDLGLMFQNPDWQLFNPTVEMEMRYRLAHPDDAMYDWALQALGLAPYEQTPPLLLSEGEKKRLALAILLMRQPRHGLLLDEPTLGQDDGHRAIVGGAARALAQAGYVVVAATHDLDWVARYVDRLILLGDGRVLDDGPVAEVLGHAAAWCEAGLLVPPWLREGSRPAAPAADSPAL